LARTLAALRELALKEARLAARRPREAAMPLAFAAVTGASVAAFAAGADAALAGLIASHLFLAYYLVLQGVVREQLEGSLDGLRTAPADPILALLAKTAAAASLIALGGAVYAASLAALSSPPPASPLGLLAWTLAVAPGLAGIAGLAASLLAYSSEPGVLAAHLSAALTAPLYLATIDAGLRAAAGDAGAALPALPASLAVAALATAYARLALE